MALPTTGPLSFNQIRTELGISQSNSSLRSMSNQAGKSTPDAVSEFRGFSNGVAIYVANEFFGYGGSSTEGYQSGTMKWSLASQYYGYGYESDTDNVTLAYDTPVQIDAYMSGDGTGNGVALEIFTNDEYLFYGADSNYGPISTTQYKTFTTSNSPNGDNSIIVFASAYYYYSY